MQTFTDQDMFHPVGLSRVTSDSWLFRT